MVIGTRRPAQTRAKAQAKSAAAPGKGWEIFWTLMGLAYYHDHRSGVTQWHCPPELQPQREEPEAAEPPKARPTKRATKLSFAEKQQLLTETQLLPLDPLSAELWGRDANEAYEGMIQHLFPRPSAVPNHANRKEARVAVGLRKLRPSTVAAVRRREELMRTRARGFLSYGKPRAAGSTAGKGPVRGRRRSTTIVGGYSSDSSRD